MEVLLANSYTMTFIGTVMIGVLMFAVSLVVFLVLAGVGSSIHGLVLLSRKVFTSVFSFAELASLQPAAASRSSDTPVDPVRPAVVDAVTLKSPASPAPQILPLNAMANHGS